MTAPKTIFEQMTDAGIKFTFHGSGGVYFAICHDAPGASIDGGTYAEAMAYFLEMLEYNRTAPGDQSASGDGGEGF